MNIYELMIGDFVRVEAPGIQSVARVTGLRNNKVYFEDSIASGKANIKSVKPIEITKELLERNGFKEGWCSQSVYEFPESKTRVEYFPGTKRLYLFNGTDVVFMSNRNIFFVHQLQQALRLAGVQINFTHF